MVVLDIVLKLDEEIRKLRDGESAKNEVKLSGEEYQELRMCLKFPTLSYEDAKLFQKESGYAVNYNGLKIIV